MINRMLVEKNIESATTERASPLLFAPDKDDPLHFSVDYCTWRAITVRDSYRHLQTDELMDRLGEVTVSCRLDDSSGHWQIKFDECGRNRHALATHHGR